MARVELELGRNDPCWCGSGKLYKHCHRREDLEKAREEKREARAERRQEQAVEAAQEAAEKVRQELELAIAPPEAPPLSPEAAAAEARWEEFTRASVEGKIAIFEATLEAGEMDAEEAFGMSQSIRDALEPYSDASARARYAELIDQLRERAPDLYEHNVAYYVSNLIDDAIADERWGAIPNLLADYVQKPEIDMFLNVMADQLQYHDQLAPLREAMEEMWPWVSESGEVMPHGVDEFASRQVMVILLDYLQTADAPQADDPALKEATEPYGGYREEWLEKAIEHLRAPSTPAWQPADFDETVDADRWAENLRGLLLDFMADRRDAGVPLGRSTIFQQELSQFLHGQLGKAARPAAGRRARRSGPQAKYTHPAASLVPDRALLDRHLAEHFGFLSHRLYRVAVVVEFLPAYLHFLAYQGVIHPETMDAALAELASLAADARRALENYGGDPHLKQAVDEAWSEEALASLRDDPELAPARSVPPTTSAPAPAPARQPGARQTFRFKVTYLRDPEVWRVIEIAGRQTLDDLHRAIQRAVEFDADHLYSFFLSNRAWDQGTEYSSPHADGPNAAQVKIEHLRLRMKQRFLYLFDYGDEHRFEVQLVGTNPDAPKDDYPKVVEKHGEAPAQYGWWDDEEDWDEDWDDEEDWDEDWDDEEDWDEDWDDEEDSL